MAVTNYTKRSKVATGPSNSPVGYYTLGRTFPRTSVREYTLRRSRSFVSSPPTPPTAQAVSFRKSRLFSKGSRVAALNAGEFEVDPRGDQSNGLSAWWPLGVYGGKADDIDYSGHKNDASRVNGVAKKLENVPGWGSVGVCDFAYLSSQYNTSPFVLDTTRPWTIFWRSKIRSHGGGFAGELNFKTNTSSGFLVVHANADANFLPMTIGSGAGFVTLKASNDFSAAIVGSWQSYALVYSGSGITTNSAYTLYRNGMQEPLVAAGTLGATPNESVIGRASTTSTFFDGEICDVRVNNYAAPEPLIKQQYAEPWRITAPIGRRTIRASSSAVVATSTIFSRRSFGPRVGSRQLIGI